MTTLEYHGSVRCFLPLLVVAVAGFGQSGSEFADPAHPPDFRRATWGMTPAEVRATEPGTPTELDTADGHVLLYSAPDLLKTGSLSYVFEGGKLVRASYQFAVPTGDLDPVIDDFHKVSRQLRLDRPEPTCDRVLWVDDSLQIERMPYLIQDRAWVSTILASDPQIGLSLSLGHFQMVEAWQTTRTRISHALSGADGKIFHRVDYRSAAAGPDPAIDACMAETPR